MLGSSASKMENGGILDQKGSAGILLQIQGPLGSQRTYSNRDMARHAHSPHDSGILSHSMLILRHMTGALYFLHKGKVGWDRQLLAISTLSRLQKHKCE